MLKDYIKKDLYEIDHHIHHLKEELQAWELLKEWKKDCKKELPFKNDIHHDTQNLPVIPDAVSDETVLSEDTSSLPLCPDAIEESRLNVPNANEFTSIEKFIYALFERNSDHLLSRADVRGVTQHAYQQTEDKRASESRINACLEALVRKKKIFRPMHGFYQLFKEGVDKVLLPPDLRNWVMEKFYNNPDKVFRLKELWNESIIEVPFLKGKTKQARYRTISSYLSDGLREGWVQSLPGFRWKLVSDAPVSPKEVIPSPMPPDDVSLYVPLLRSLFKIHAEELNREFIETYIREECDLQHLEFNETAMVASLTSLTKQGFIKLVSKNVWQRIENNN